MGDGGAARVNTVAGMSTSADTLPVTSDRWLVAVCAGLTLAVYAPVLQFEFLFDDLNWVHVPPRGSMAPWIVPAWLGGGLPWAFHAFVVALHLLNGVLLWTLARRWLSSTAALLTIALFWLHPISTEAVAYVSGGRDVLLTTYVLVAAVGILAWRWWSVALGLLSLGLALSLKPSALPLLLVVPLMAGYRPRWDRWAVLEAAALVAVAWWFVRPALTAMSFDLACGACLAALWGSLARVVWPVGFSVEHESASVCAASLAIAGTAFTGGLAWRSRARWAAPWYAWLWIVGLVLPRSLTSDSPLAERHLYLPLIAVWLLVGAVLDRRLLP